MDQKELFQQAIDALSGPEPAVDIGSIKGSNNWNVIVNGVQVCNITEIEKTSLMGPLQDYSKVDAVKQKQMISDMYADTKAFLERKSAELDK
ncbi:MAG: hypothetical protein WCT03_20785 [Candidatus Obscuribacterales bacterium]|jgi:hypothetical protein